MSPNDNLNFYYNKYNKGKRTISALDSRFLDIQNEIRYFEEIKMFIEKENDFIGIEEIENELNLTNNGHKSKIKLNLNKPKKRDLLRLTTKAFQITSLEETTRKMKKYPFQKDNLTTFGCTQKIFLAAMFLFYETIRKFQMMFFYMQQPLLATIPRLKKVTKLQLTTAKENL